MDGTERFPCGRSRRELEETGRCDRCRDKHYCIEYMSCETKLDFPRFVEYLRAYNRQLYRQRDAGEVVYE